VRYVHSDIDTVERVEIIRDLRRGEFDVLVGINLLREGLDMPELHSKGGSEICLTQPYPKAQLLRHWLEAREVVDIATFLDIAIALSDCLAERHQHTLIHKGIKPSNILIEEDPVRIQIIDDVRVLDGMMISQFIQDQQYRRQSLPYIAPEQTGRIRMDIDYCCDLYAVGTVLYECLSGEPLFYSDDALDIIQSIIAPIWRKNPGH